MHRSPRVVVAWIAAAVVAIMTMRVVASDLGTLHRRARSLGPDVRAIVATRDLALGTTIGPGDVRVVVRPSSVVASDAVHDARAAVGRIVAADVLAGDIVHARALATPAGAGLDGVIDTGLRGVHVGAKDGFRPPLGAVVDVLATFDPSTVVADGAARGRAVVVARGARVLAVDGETGADGTPTSGVTLLVTEAEAQSVAYAATIGQVILALAPPGSASSH
jgi:Flp pilus assembly protein CpaB